MAFKQTAVHWRKTLAELVEKPHAFVKRQMASGNHSHSYTSALLGKGDVTGEKEHIVKWSAASLYAGGADTVRSQASHSFQSDLTTIRTNIDRVLAIQFLPHDDNVSRSPAKGSGRD